MSRWLQLFLPLLEQASNRPAMYVGTTDLSRLADYFNGFWNAVELDEPGTSLMWSQFSVWIQGTYLISHPGWGWTHILCHEFKEERIAIEALPGLFQRFLLARDVILAGGPPDLTQWLDARMWMAYGGVSYAPGEDIFPSPTTSISFAETERDETP